MVQGEFEMTIPDHGFVPTDHMSFEDTATVEYNAMVGGVELDQRIAGRVRHRKEGCDRWYCNTLEEGQEMHRYSKDQLFILLTIAIDRLATLEQVCAEIDRMDIE
jgi:hypothetical protein